MLAKYNLTPKSLMFNIGDNAAAEDNVAALNQARQQQPHHLRWKSWTLVSQKTRVFCSMLFTVPYNGGP
jgi:hypothetical protein